MLGFEVGREWFLRFAVLRLDSRTDWTYTPSRWIGGRAGADVRLQTSAIDSMFPVPPAEGFGGQFNFSAAEPVRRNEVTPSNAVGGYAAVDLHPRKGSTISAGLRGDYFARFEAGTVSPRLSIEQAIGRRVTARAAIGDYSRPADGPEALAVHLQPERATQYVLGGEARLPGGLAGSVSLFYTDLRRLVTQDFTRGGGDPVQAYASDGTGRAYGVEALVRLRRDDFFGWLAYSYARSERTDGPGGTERLFDYDQPHNLIAVGSWRWRRWRFGGRFQLATGVPSTPVIGSIFQSDLNIYLPVLGELNSERLPTSHQLDVRIDRAFAFDAWDLSVYLDVTNVYAHPKVLAYQYSFDFSERGEITELPIVPAIGLRGTF
jgi:outer membrane receptor protein involved in Fe transport